MKNVRWGIEEIFSGFRQLAGDTKDKIRIRTQELQESVEKLQKENRNLEQEVKKRVEAENRIKNSLQKEKELSELRTKFQF